MQNYVELNQAQQVSESDPFTLDRYAQFFRHFPNSATSVLDVGSNTGRGGAVLKKLKPDLKLKRMLEQIGFVQVQIRGSGKISRLLGENFPLMMAYGSYLAIADKL